jgi:hypothetical protein
MDSAIIHDTSGFRRLAPAEFVVSVLLEQSDLKK